MRGTYKNACFLVLLGLPVAISLHAPTWHAARISPGASRTSLEISHSPGSRALSLRGGSPEQENLRGVLAIIVVIFSEV